VTADRATRLGGFFLLSGAMNLGYGSIYTLLADLRDRFGFSGAQLGAIVAAGFFAGFVAQLFLGRYSDRGHAALMVRIGITLAALAMLASAVATPTGRSSGPACCSASAAAWWARRSAGW